MQVKSASVRDGFFYSLMVGIGETYFAAYALALDFGTWGAALVAVLPVVIGAVLQFSSFLGPRLLRSKKIWVLLCASLQASSMILLATLAAYNSVDLRDLILIASIYWAAGFSAGPPWNAWMSQIISKAESVVFFSYRSRVAQWATLLGVIAGGILLHEMEFEDPVHTFVFLFLIAGIARVLSVYYLSRHPRDVVKSHRSALNDPFLNRPLVRFRDVFRSQHWVLLFYGFLSSMTVYISSPYCTPYMLETLGVTYREFMLITASAFVARMVGYELAGKWIQSRGLTFSAMVGAAGIVMVPFLWPHAQSLTSLILLHVLSGLTWAAQDIAVFLLFFHHFEEEERSRLLTLSNFVNSMGMALGTVLGGYWMGLMGDFLSGRSDYSSLFYMSGAMRMLPLVLTPLIFSRAIAWRTMITRTLGVRAGQGALDRPVLYLGNKVKDRRVSPLRPSSKK